jgi:transcription antitermination factor NusG
VEARRRWQRIDARGVIFPETKGFRNIKVTAGPSANLVGQMERMDENGRVRVLLEIMGGTVRVALPHTLVAPS